jgi:heme/copper-type cytochrome/quinol oxidase subunit 4
VLVLGSRRSHVLLSLLLLVFTLSVSLEVVSLSFLIDDLLSFEERLLMVLLLAVLVLLKVEFNHVDVHSRFENLRFLALKESVEFT